METIHNKKHLKTFRRELRNNLTPAEATMWKALQQKKLEGRKFRRQHSVGKYVLDFYCPTERLAVELDGAEHFTVHGSLHDEERDDYLKSLNIRVVRFENKEVYNNLEMVLEEIKSYFREK
jgi:very-short-patch-repair endonuclease